MSEETRKDFVLLIITSIASAIGMTSVFVACRPLAWSQYLFRTHTFPLSCCSRQFALMTALLRRGGHG
jgi:hypothetical protein